MSDNSSVTHESLVGQKHLRELSRYLRIRRRFWDQLNQDGAFLVDYFIARSFSECNQAGLGAKARELISAAEFENAQLPSISELGSLELEAKLLSRLARIAYRLESGKRRRKKLRVLLEKSLASTLADLRDLGLEREAKKVIKRATASVRAKRQRQALARK